MKCISTNIKHCVIIQRGLDEDRVYVICNMSDKYLTIPLINELNLLNLISGRRLIDNITGADLNTEQLKLTPYQVVWASLTD